MDNEVHPEITPVAETTDTAEANSEEPSEGVEDKKTTSSHSSQSSDNEAPPSSPEPKKPPELVAYWDAVKNHPSDFTGWTYLLQYVEQKNITEFYREAFDEFFTHYPYCYGYWKKYGDTERKHGNPERAYKVFERGVEAIPLCPDLWIHYITFQIQDLLQDEMRKEKIRELFERAVKACGLDYRSDKLWEYYLQFEKQHSDYVRVTAIYDRLLNTPIQHLRQHMTDFKELIRSHSPKETLSLDEFLKLRTEYVSSKEIGDTSMEKEADEKEAEGPPGDERPPGGDESGESTNEAPAESNGVPSPGGDMGPPGEEVKAEKELSDAAELDGIKELAIKVREEVFRKMEQDLSKRKKFEDLIRRPYFHAKPLERGQLKNWKNYLDFEVQEGSKERTKVLFERSVIACALYEEMWQKYATHMETAEPGAASDVYRRACKIHLPKKAPLHLRWAAFEESQGSMEVARTVLSDLEQSMPGVVSVMLERVGLERRQKEFSRVRAMLTQYIESSEKADHLTFFASKLACFLHKVVGDLDAAKDVLEKAIQEKGIQEVLYMKLVDLEYQRTPIDEEQTCRVFQQILEKDLPLETKLIFSKRRLEFCRDFSQNVKRFQAAQDEHNKLLRQQQSALRKRKLQTEDESGDSNKKPKTNDSTTLESSTSQPVSYPQQALSYPQQAPPVATTSSSTYPQPHYSQQTFQQPQADHGYNYQQQWQSYQNPYQYQQQPQPQQPQWNTSYGSGYYPS